MTPAFLGVGHIVKDITSSGWRPGGSVYYAAAQARRLGLGVAAVTSCANDLDPPAILADIHWHVVSSTETTTFENRYAGTRRTQRVLARAKPLCLTGARRPPSSSAPCSTTWTRRCRRC